MTIPTQHNCEHLPDGWCLACVGQLARERDAAKAVADSLAVRVAVQAELLAKCAENVR